METKAEGLKSPLRVVVSRGGICVSLKLSSPSLWCLKKVLISESDLYCRYFNGPFSSILYPLQMSELSGSLGSMCWLCSRYGKRGLASPSSSEEVRVASRAMSSAFLPLRPWMITVCCILVCSCSCLALSARYDTQCQFLFYRQNEHERPDM